MASPAASTPSSAGSPAAIQLAPHPPTLAIKQSSSATMTPLAPQAAGMPTPPIMTSKEWIIPPRPKPGRKPATDTPPTKRKAQNRAAQRAFRERRAARVGELEEQLEETKEEQQKREEEMRAKILRLEAEVERYSGEIHSWRVRCETLDRIAEYERGEKERALGELKYLRNGSRTTGTDAVPLPPRNMRYGHQNQHQHQHKAPEPVPEVQAVPEPRPPQPEQYIPYQQQSEEAIGCGNCTTATTGTCACLEEAIAISTSGCGKCTPDTHCECLEETIREASSVETPYELKRSHSPSTDTYSDKRQRQSDPGTPLEMDFTAQYSSKPVQQVYQPPPQEVTIHTQQLQTATDSCGFCEEGTYCMCAEAAAAAASSDSNSNQNHENRLAPLLNEVTPPPSDSDMDVSMKLPGLHPSQMHRPLPSNTIQSQSKASNSCVNGPGTCQQCLSDPKSGLFCRSLAALRSVPGSTVPEGCCGGNANGGGCCKTQSVPNIEASQPPPSFSCAETYKTLSTHKGFEQASDELDTWLGRLNTTDANGKGNASGRGPLEIEAASVMGVLKLFDRRFGRG